MCVAAVYLTCVMMISGLSILCSILVLRVRHGEPSKRAPARLRRLVLHRIGPVLQKECMCTRPSGEASADHNKPTASDTAPKADQTTKTKKSSHIDCRSHRLDISGAVIRSNAISPQSPGTTDTVFPERGHSLSTDTTDVSLEHTINPIHNAVWQSNQEYRETILAGEGQEDNFIYNIRPSDNNKDEVDEAIPPGGGPVTTPSEDTHTAFDNLLEWHTMGRVLDRLFFVIFLTATIVVTSTLAFIYAFCSPTTVELTPVA